MWHGAYRSGAPRSKRAERRGDLPGCHAGRRAVYVGGPVWNRFHLGEGP